MANVEVEWSDTGYTYDVGVTVVSQVNVDYTLGELTGVQMTGLTVTENYNSDSRVQAKVTTIVGAGESDGYVDNARLRIILIIPERNWSRELMTGYVSDIDEVYESGYIKRQYTLEGTIWGLLEHKTNAAVTIAKGAKMLDVWSKLMKDQTRMQYSTASATKDHPFSAVTLYEAGTQLSTILFEVVSGYCRMDSDGHGTVVLNDYTPPSKKTPTRVIDYNDLKNLVMAPLNMNSTKYEAPGRAVVTATVSSEDKNGKTVQETLVGYYDAPSEHATSMNTRGYLRSRSDSYSGSSEKPSKSELDAEAKKNWENEQDKGVEWTAESAFADYRVGEVATLILPSDRLGIAMVSKKVHITGVLTNLETFTQSLTMKEV